MCNKLKLRTLDTKPWNPSLHVMSLLLHWQNVSSWSSIGLGWTHKSHLIVSVRASLVCSMNWIWHCRIKKKPVKLNGILTGFLCAHLFFFLSFLVVIVVVLVHFWLWSIKYCQQIMNIICSLYVIFSLSENFNHHQPMDTQRHHHHQKVFRLKRTT